MISQINRIISITVNHVIEVNMIFLNNIIDSIYHNDLIIHTKQIVINFNDFIIYHLPNKIFQYRIYSKHNSISQLS